MDSEGKIESNSLTCHYEGFDVRYVIQNNFVVKFVIINNTNKSLIIDKSKSYVLYDGYSNQLFKDVRSSRSTTFNNVQDAINNVQTNESGVSMTVPPYSKWELPIQETNVREIKKLPKFIKEVGIHSLTSFDNQETVEFVIPYSFDYSMAKWSTCRNRIYVNSIETEAINAKEPVVEIGPSMISDNRYWIIQKNGEADFSEANRIDLINQKMYMKHSKKVAASRWFWGTVTLPAGIGILFYMGAYSMGKYGCNHEPKTYGNVVKYQYSINN